ncbi:hypothetical protein [Eubacterium aggregans]|uniref:hypothetical protein n=1 Tax=Eubacterium aggregans TaxID=81409 RepID=UPI003F3272BE
MSDSTGYAALFGLIMSFAVVFIVIGIVLYVFTALALYTMAKNKGIEYAWLAWIPVANGYVMGEVMDDKVAIGSSVIPYAKWILLLGSIVTGLLAMIPYIVWIFSILYLVYYYCAIYRLYKLYKPDNAVLYLVLSIIFGITMPFFIFSMRNNTPQEYLN